MHVGTFAAYETPASEKRDRLLVRIVGAESSVAEARALALGAPAKSNHPSVKSLAESNLRAQAIAMRAMAVRALGMVDATESARAIVAAAADPSNEVRAAAASALSKVPTAEAREVLERLRLDTDAYVRRSAEDAIRASPRAP